MDGMRCLAIAALLAGCSETLSLRVTSARSDVRDGVIRDPSPEMRDLLDDALGRLGVEYDLTSKVAGSVTIDLVEVAEGEPKGRTMIRSGCQRALRSPHDSMILAHEIGHALGLEHVDDTGNLMHADGGEWLDDWQVDDLLTDARKLSRC
jgi:hypothetical protein